MSVFVPIGAYGPASAAQPARSPAASSTLTASSTATMLSGASSVALALSSVGMDALGASTATATTAVTGTGTGAAAGGGAGTIGQHASGIGGGGGGGGGGIEFAFASTVTVPSVGGTRVVSRTSSLGHRASLSSLSDGGNNNNNNSTAPDSMLRASSTPDIPSLGHNYSLSSGAGVGGGADGGAHDAGGASPRGQNATSWYRYSESLDSISVSTDDITLVTAHASMHKTTLRFKAHRLEAQYLLLQLEAFGPMLRTWGVGTLLVSLAIGIPIMLRAAHSPTGIPASFIALFCACAGLCALLTLFIAVAPKSTLVRFWDIVCFCLGSGYAIPMFAQPAVCVASGIAPVMEQCIPQYAGLVPLLPLVMAVAAPHVAVSLSRTPWYGACALSLLYALVVPSTYAASNYDLVVILALLVVLLVNSGLASFVAYLTERDHRAGVWLSLMNKQGATVLAATEGARVDEAVRNTAFHIFADASQQMLYELDVSNNFVYVSHTCERLLGWTAVELAGKSHSLGICHDDVEKVAAHFESLRRGTTARCVLQFRRTRNDGSIAWLEMVAVLAQTPNGPVLMASERDVGSEVQAREDMMLERQRRVAASTAQAAYEETLGYACHELRNPLHVIQASLTMLVETPLTQDQHDTVTVVMTSVHQMRTLVDDILDVERLRAGRLTLVAVATDPMQLVRDLVAQHRSFAHVALVCDVGDNIPSQVMVASDRVVQVLNNGLTNACKFCSTGVIRVRVMNGNTAHSLRFEVRNTGRLPSRAMFRRFDTSSPVGVTGDPTNTRGTGLGLRISASLVSALRGELNLEDLPVVERVAEAPDALTETVFWFQIPFEPIDGAIVSHTDVQTASVTVPETQALGSVASRPTSQHNLGLHVLYVDDEFANRRVAESMLKKLGCTYQLLEDGDQVLAADPSSFDAILMDILMRRMNGDDCMKLLVENNIRTPCFAVSGNTDNASIQSYFRVGFHDVMGKPFTIQQLQRLLEPVAARRAPVLPGSM